MSGTLASGDIASVKEWVRWAADLSMRLCPHHQWPGPRPSASDGCFDAGVLRDREELQLLAEVVLRASRGETHGDLEQWVRQVQGEAVPPVVSTEPTMPGTVELPHGWERPRGAYLYGPFWLFACQGMRLNDEQFAQYLASPEQRDSTHVVIDLSTGTRPALGEQPFHALATRQTIHHVRQRLRTIIAAGKSPWAYVCSQEYFIQEMGGDHRRLIPFLEESAETFGDLCSHITPFREIGDIYHGDRLQERHEIVSAIRRKTDPNRTAVAVHERAGEGIPVRDVDGLDGTVSALQAPFDWNVRGDYEAGGHEYDGVVGFYREHAARMTRYQRAGRIGRHSVGIFECSIPPGRGFTRRPRTFEQARRFGESLIREGVAWELSGGAAPRA
jgi:hypothetical protein